MGAVAVWADEPSGQEEPSPRQPLAKNHTARNVAGIALGGRRARVALVALALAEHPIPAERLATMVWAGEPPVTWQPALRGVIRALRTAVSPIGLGDQALITTEPAGYALVGGCETDVGRARADLSSAESEADPKRALQLADSASVQSGRDLLPAEDAEWLRPHRDGIDQLRARAVAVIVRSAGALGDHHRALASARALLDDRPLDEHAHQTLIGALDRAGDRSGAVQAYERCRAVLAEELGIDPSADTVATYLQALRADQRPPGPRLPNPTGALIGRDSELETLSALVAAPGVVTLTGRGGVGKSRLALAAARTAHGLWVSLGSTADDELVASQVALDLGPTVGDADPTALLTDHLAPLGPTLLALDGCDQVLDGVASLVSTLTGGCPSLTVLCTARRTLGLDGERVLHLDPLPAIGEGTDPVAGLEVSPQFQLLRHRIRTPAMTWR